MGSQLDGLQQRLVIVGLSWFNPVGSYADYDYVSLATPPTVQFSSGDYGVSEDAGPALVTATLSAVSSSTVTVDYATTDGTALAGSDYVTTSGTLTFTPGVTTQTFSVPIVNDRLDEPSETVILTLTNPSHAIVGTPNPATLTIVDDDPLPTVQFMSSDITLTHSITFDSGYEDYSSDIAIDSSGNMVVTGRSSNGANNDFRTIKYDSTGAMLWNVTYDAGGNEEPAKVAVDAAGNVYVSGSSDVAPAGLRLIKYNSAGVQQWVVSDASGAWGYMISGAVPDESGNVYVATSEFGGYRHLIKYDSAGNVVWAKTDTLTGCNRSGDIARDAGGNLYVTGFSCDTFRTTEYDSNGDAIWDRIYNPGVWDYSFDVTLDGSGNVYVSGFSTDNTTYRESVLLKYDNAGNLLWDRRYDAGQYSYAYGIAADNLGNVYMGVNKILLDWSPIDIHIVKYDSAGTLSQIIVYDSGADDGAGGIAVDRTGNVIYVAGHSFNGSNFDLHTLKYSRGIFFVNEDAGPATITVTLSAASSFTVTTDYATSDGTATAVSDYTAVSGTLTFAPGLTSQTFSVPILDDEIDEPAETVTLTLSGPVHAALGIPAVAVLTIVDDNDAPVAVDDAFTVTEDSQANALAVLANDTDPELNPLAVSAVGAPDQGGVAISAVTHITYTPAADFYGLETFTYTVSDGQGGYDSAMVAVTVTPVCDCAVELEPPAAAQTGDAGTTITYTLRVTNSGDCADVLDVTVVALWPAEAPATVGPLAAGAGTDVVVTVTIPAEAGNQDVATVTFTSQGDGEVSAASVLTTTVNTPTYRVYLPLVVK